MKMNKRDNVKPMSNGTKLLKATVEMNLLKALADDMLCVYHIGDGGRIEMHSKAKVPQDDLMLLLMVAEAVTAAMHKLDMSQDEVIAIVNALLPYIKSNDIKDNDDEDDDEDDEEDDDE